MLPQLRSFCTFTPLTSCGKHREARGRQAAIVGPDSRTTRESTTVLLVMLLLVFPGAVTAATPNQARPPADEADLERWLQNMVWYHHFSLEEMEAATGLPESRLRTALARFRISPQTRPVRAADAPLLVLPYPGGRHPRIGFLEGAIDPQRETKISVFTPWDDKSYVVVDVPEAIWSNLGLTYLAHTHIPTLWDEQGVTLPQQEWSIANDGTLTGRRRLPNGIEFGSRVHPEHTSVRMEMWLTNGTPDTPDGPPRAELCDAQGSCWIPTANERQQDLPGAVRGVSLTSRRHAGSSRPGTPRNEPGGMPIAPACTPTHSFPTAVRARRNGSAAGYRSTRARISSGSFSGLKQPAGGSECQPVCTCRARWGPGVISDLRIAGGTQEPADDLRDRIFVSFLIFQRSPFGMLNKGLPDGLFFRHVLVAQACRSGWADSSRPAFPRRTPDRGPPS